MDSVQACHVSTLTPSATQDQQGGKGFGVDEEEDATMTTNEDQYNLQKQEQTA